MIWVIYIGHTDSSACRDQEMHVSMLLLGQLPSLISASNYQHNTQGVQSIASGLS